MARNPHRSLPRSTSHRPPTTTRRFCDYHVPNRQSATADDCAPPPDDQIVARNAHCRCSSLPQSNSHRPPTTTRRCCDHHQHHYRQSATADCCAPPPDDQIVGRNAHCRCSSLPQSNSHRPPTTTRRFCDHHHPYRQSATADCCAPPPHACLVPRNAHCRCSLPQPQSTSHRPSTATRRCSDHHPNRQSATADHRAPPPDACLVPRNLRCPLPRSTSHRPSTTTRRF